MPPENQRHGRDEWVYSPWELSLQVSYGIAECIVTLKIGYGTHTLLIESSITCGSPERDLHIHLKLDHGADVY
jgi:hypothetical protein